MSYEVEAKFRIVDLAALERRIISLGGTFGEPIEENDRFYQHPARDFAATDEGLRIRLRGTGPDRECRITYKGPKIDRKTKTRREIEIPLQAERFEEWDRLLQALGFRPAGTVWKRRKICSLSFEGRDFEITIDELPVLADENSSGLFSEIETSAESETLESARESLLKFAATLPLGENIRQGYLEMILDRRP